MFRLPILLLLVFARPALADPIGPIAPPEIETADHQSQGGSNRSDRPLGTIASESSTSDAESASPTPFGARSWLTGTAMPLLGVLALIVAMAWIYRKFARTQSGLSSMMGAGGHAPSGVLSVLGRFPVGGGMTLVLLQLDRRVLLVAHSAGSTFRGRPGSMSVLSEIRDEESVASLLVRTQDARGESMSQRFNELLEGYEADDGEITESGLGTGVDLLVDETVESAGAEASPSQPGDASVDLSPLRRRLERLMRNTQVERAAP